MDVRLLKRYLGETEEHLDVARLRVARQATVLRVMKAEGEDVRIALQLLTQFEQVFATFENIRAFIVRELGNHLPAGAGDD